VKKHHLINYSISKNDAGSSDGFGGGTRLQRLFQALKRLTGDTGGLRNSSTVDYSCHIAADESTSSSPVGPTSGAVGV
jgi:hypothetical protein